MIKEEQYKEYLVEQYNKVLFFESAPPFIDKTEVMSVDDYFEKEEDNNNLVDAKIPQEEDSEDFDDAKISPANIGKIADPEEREKQKKRPTASRTNKLLHNTTIKGIVGDDGNELDLEKLKRIFLQTPSQLIGQNDKMKASGGNKQSFYDISLPAYQGLFFNKKLDRFEIVRTCPSAGECTKFCYAAKGGYLMFPTSSEAGAKTMTFLMNDYEGFKKTIIANLKKAQASAKANGKQAVLRWHDSGDFFSEQYLDMALEIAKKTPDVLHYAYTKQLPLIRRRIKDKKVPQNFVFNYSYGGIHDKSINPMTDKHSQVVPAKLFKDLFADGQKWQFDDEGVEKLKKRTAEHFGMPLESIITYDEMKDIEPTNEPFYNVLVWKGHGDDAATRKDVIGTLLLIH